MLLFASEFLGSISLYVYMILIMHKLPTQKKEEEKVHLPALNETGN